MHSNIIPGLLNETLGSGLKWHVQWLDHIFTVRVQNNFLQIFDETLEWGKEMESQPMEWGYYDILHRNAII